MRIAYGLVQGLVCLCDGGQGLGLGLGLGLGTAQGQGLARLTNPSPQYAMLVRYLIGDFPPPFGIDMHPPTPSHPHP